MAKDYFAENNVAYEEFNVAADAVRRQEMIDKSGQLGVPVIIIGDTDLVVGFNKPVIANLLGLKA